MNCLPHTGATRAPHQHRAAAALSESDAEAQEASEMIQDAQAYRQAKMHDDGKRMTLAQLRAELAE